MTIIAHALWAVALSNPIKKMRWKKAVFWAIFPDLFWGIPFVSYLLIFHQSIPTDFDNAVWWLYHLYGFSHSFIIAGLVILVTSILSKKFSREMLAWPLMHILVDIPGHTHFRTPFLYPISNFTFSGVFSWGESLPAVFSHFFPLLFISLFYLRGKIQKG